MCYARPPAKDSHKASRSKGKGKKAEETPSTTPASTNTPSALPVTSACANAGTTTHFESSDNACLRSSDPSHPLRPLQLDADIDWNADTGATAHMTPHYSPQRVPIKLPHHTTMLSILLGLGLWSFNQSLRERVLEQWS